MLPILEVNVTYQNPNSEWYADGGFGSTGMVDPSLAAARKEVCQPCCFIPA